MRALFLLKVLVLVAFSHWQQDVEEADTAAICNRTSLSSRSTRPASSRECGHFLVTVKISPPHPHEITSLPLLKELKTLTKLHQCNCSDNGQRCGLKGKSPNPDPNPDLSAPSKLRGASFCLFWETEFSPLC